MTGLRVTVVVGTDHHPFARLVDWADARQRLHPDDQVTVQYGYSRPPTLAEGVSLLPPDALHELVASSDAVITHGGPGTVMGARTAGHLPLVLPRDPDLGEHVDQHQMRFAAWAARKELLRLVDDLGHLDRELTRLGAGGTRTTVSPGHSVRDSTSRLVSLLDQLDHSPARVTAPGAVPALLVTGPRPFPGCRRVFELLGGAPGAVPVGDAGLTAGLTAGLGDLAAARRSPEVRRRVLEAVAPRTELLRAARDEAGGAGVVVVYGPPRSALALALDPRLDLRVLWVGGRGAGLTCSAARRALRRRRVPLAVLRPDADAAEIDRVWQQLAGRQTTPRAARS